MRIRIILFLIIFFAVYYSGKAQSQSEIIDNIIKFRSEYVADSIPAKFKGRYDAFNYSSNQLFYDTLKLLLPEIFFCGKTLYWSEYYCPLSDSQEILLCTDSFKFHFNLFYDRLFESKKITIRELQINNNLNNKSVVELFLEDIEQWNENVTNRSYYYWIGADGGYFLCSKISFTSEQIEIFHAAFNFYFQFWPIFYLKEQPEDDYQIRMQPNCDWIIKKGENSWSRIHWGHLDTEEKREEYIWREILGHIEKEIKVFDCEGNKIEIEYIEE